MAALCVGANARAQRNASFESGGADALAGWSLYRPDDPLRGVAIAVDATVAAAGARSLKIEQQSATGFTRVAQRLRSAELVPASGATAAPARRLRLRAALRAGGAATADRTGRVYADAIEPERPVQGAREAGAATLDDVQVRAAAEWLATQASCRSTAFESATGYSSAARLQIEWEIAPRPDSKDLDPDGHR